MSITDRPDALVKYVSTKMDTYWQDWPTVRQLAKRYKCKQDEIIDIVYDQECLDLIVGMRNNAGIGEFDSVGDYRVEYYEIT